MRTTQTRTQSRILDVSRMTIYSTYSLGHAMFADEETVPCATSATRVRINNLASKKHLRIPFGSLTSSLTKRYNYVDHDV